MTLPPSLDEDALSRVLARFYCREDRLFSALCHERRWTSPKWFFLCAIVDQHFRRVRGERGHCRAAYLRERAETADLPDRARLAGL